MNTYKRHRFPPDIISYAVWLYYRFKLKRAVAAIAISKLCCRARLSQPSRWFKRIELPVRGRLSEPVFVRD
jgi:hypothetical protein